jgi:amidase
VGSGVVAGRTNLLRLLLGVALVASLLGVWASAATAAPTLDLETLDGLTAEQMMAAGQLTSVQLTQAYIDRIDTLDLNGPGLNAVTQFNKNALGEAAASDKRRAEGQLLGPADGLPILLKDLIDVKGMYTSAGNYSLRNSFPEVDSGVAKNLHAHGVVILGKTGLSEFANFFGNQHSGFSNLTGQVINGIDADQGPSGSSSGTGAAAAAGLSALTIGTETSGSIISPSQNNGIVGLRPTVGLVPGYGIAPISASQDTAGPMDRTVSNVALTLQSIAGYDPDNEAYYHGIWGPGVTDESVIPPVPHDTPDYVSALDPSFVQGKRIGYNGDITTPGPLKSAYDALVAGGAIMVSRPQTTVGTIPPGFSLNYEAHRDITHYYQHLGPLAPIHSLEEEIADNQANEHEALKFGNSTHAASAAIDVSDDSAASVAYRAGLVGGKTATHKAIDDMMNNETPGDPSDDFIAILGGVPQGARAGFPQLTIPMGYNATTRRAVNVSVNGNAYDERNLIGVAYVVEQGTHLRKPASQVNPSMYRCADTVPAPPFASRGGCNPDYDTLMKMVGTAPDLPFALDAESAKSLQQRMTAGTLTSEELTKAYLARIALTNTKDPAIQAVRDINPDAIAEAKALDAERGSSGARGPLHGLPILLDASFDVGGLPTSAGSIALQHSMPAKSAKVVRKLEAAGAGILGKTNVSELNGLFSANMVEGYSSLGGQVLLPSDTDNNPAGSSGGSAAAAASGMAAMTVGLETSTDTAQMIAPAGVAGVVALKPTVGRVSRSGVLGVAKSQDSPGPIARTVYDAATELQAVAGEDPVGDPATSGAPAVPDYLAGLTPTALSGKKVAVTSSSTAPYPSVISAIQGLGASTSVVTIGTPSPNPASIVTREFKRDLNNYLAGNSGGDAETLQEVIAYNNAHPVEGLKYGQTELLDAQNINLSDPTTAAAYDSDKSTGKASNQALIDTILNNGTPADASDDFYVIAVPSGNSLVGIADRAGYPVLTVPAGYGTGGSGRNPIGVTLVGGAFSEDKLLDAAYAFEQATTVRLEPSWTNPSMWRCVPYSGFYLPHHCRPGEVDALTETPPGPTVTPPTVPAAGAVAPAKATKCKKGKRLNKKTGKCVKKKHKK